jgi:hypothetical protein
MIQTEHSFTLPLGYLDKEGNIHREGTMRLATAADEILPLKDPRVQANSAYLVVILMSRVVTSLGHVGHINPKMIEELYAADLAYLQELYNRINRTGKVALKAECPRCATEFEVDLAAPGESSATP